MILRRSISCSPLLSFFLSPLDTPKGETPTEKLAVDREDKTETGWDRLKRAATPNEFGELSLEANSVIQAGCMSIFVGGMYGGFMGSKDAHLEFFRTNQATAFNDHLHAKKKLQDHMTIAFGKGAARWAMRATIFTCGYVGISTAISVYRNKNGIREHVIAGAATGALYKFNMGPRGWVVGGGLGLLLGFIAGGTTYTILKLTGMTMNDVRYWNYQWKETRGRQMNASFRKYLDKEESELYQDHIKKLGHKLDMEELSSEEVK